MSPRNSSSARGHVVAAVAAATFVALAACTKSETGAPAPSPSATVPASYSRIGYVKMEQLIKIHPLYGQLAHYDETIAALSLRSSLDQGAPTLPAAELAKEDKALQAALDDARTRTKKLLDDKQKEYAKRENEAIAAALRTAGVPMGPGTSTIAGSVNTVAAQQRNAAAKSAQADFDAYRKTLIAQDEAAMRAVQRAAESRADRAFRAKADELQTKEQQLAFDLATKDSPDRLSLRTRLSNLALDDASRDDAKQKLAAIDRTEADALAAQRNRDQATLAALRSQLKDQVRGEIAADSKRVQADSLAKLKARGRSLQQQFGGASGTVVAQQATDGTVAVPAGVSPALKQRLEDLHKAYQAQFTEDAKRTIADFKKTNDDLTRRFNQLHGVDDVAQRNAQTHIATLQKERDDLYRQMVAQIGREVRVVAQNRGVTTVLDDIVAPANGVDLTADAQKDIESLHE
jgi:hypothetical protein